MNNSASNLETKTLKIMKEI